MSNYLKLVDFEIKRFWKIYVALLSVVVVMECGFVTYESLYYKGLIEAGNYGGEPLTLSYLTSSSFFELAPTLCIAILVLYVFFTWYREWFSKNTFAFQLLLLPFNRMTIYLAKLSSIVLFILGCLVTQLALYPLLKTIFQAILPTQFRMDITLVQWLWESSDLFDLLIPLNATDFLLYYGIGIAGVIVVFTVILLERSFRLKGIFFSVLFLSVCLFLLLFPALLHNFVLPLYESEYVALQIMVIALIVFASLFLSYYLMKKKIWV
ncbi:MULTISPECIES: hypothetical protein [Bacillus]|uniref:hypothetical protein n=1 Tax=Bacillus TaxID=1386 RepID=UPI0003102B01|nr:MULTISPECIES: hypothetical protein [Bacillus]